MDAHRYVIFSSLHALVLLHHQVICTMGKAAIDERATQQLEGPQDKVRVLRFAVVLFCSFEGKSLTLWSSSYHVNHVTNAVRL